MLSGGRGGDGKSSLHREKHRPRMGPDGGDGGRGGRLTLVADPGVPDLFRYRDKRAISAPAGAPGGRNRKSGAAGAEHCLPVPVGTRVEDEAGETIVDLLEPGAEWSLDGGRGGRGNARFATARNRAPKRAEQGRQGETREVTLRFVDPAQTVLISLGDEAAGLHEALTGRDYGGEPPTRPMPGVRVDPVLGHERILLLPALGQDGEVDFSWLRQAARARRVAWVGEAPAPELREAVEAALPPGVEVLLAGPGDWPGAVPASAEEWPAP